MTKKAEVRRDGARVTITVQCSEIYEAMRLYDELNEALKSGHATITVTTPRALEIIAREAGEGEV
jgi:hypothetical protein